MITESLERFAGHMQNNWTGKEVSITKTTTMPEIKIQLDEVRVLPWQKVVKPIREKHPSNSNFLSVMGKDMVNTQAGEDGKVRNFVIHVDPHTVFDLRDSRLVLLSDKEVIQFKLREPGQ